MGQQPSTKIIEKTRGEVELLNQLKPSFLVKDGYLYIHTIYTLHIVCMKNIDTIKVSAAGNFIQIYVKNEDERVQSKEINIAFPYTAKFTQQEYEIIALYMHKEISKQYLDYMSIF